MFPESIKFRNTYFLSRDVNFSRKAILNKDFIGFYEGQVCAIYVSESFFRRAGDDYLEYAPLAIFVNKRLHKVHRDLFYGKEDVKLFNRNYPCIFKLSNKNKIDFFEDHLNKVSQEYKKILDKFKNLKTNE